MSPRVVHEEYDSTRSVLIALIAVLVLVLIGLIVYFTWFASRSGPQQTNVRVTVPSGSQPGGTAAGPSAPGAGQRVDVSMTADNQFDLADVTAKAGSIVKWTNDDVKPHTVTADKTGGPDSDSRYPDGVDPGKSFSWTVPPDAVPGAIYYYHCAFHGQPGDGKSRGTGMTGSITVQ